VKYVRIAKIRVGHSIQYVFWDFKRKKTKQDMITMNKKFKFWKFSHFHSSILIISKQ